MKTGFGLFGDLVDFREYIRGLCPVSQRLFQIFIGQFAVDISFDATHCFLGLAEPQAGSSAQSGKFLGANHQQCDYQDEGQFQKTDVEHRNNRFGDKC